MTSEQFIRWWTFADRMARTCYATSRRPSCAWICDTIDFFFECFTEENIAAIESWDNEPYPCDQMTEFLDNRSGYPPQCRACRDYDNDEPCRCDEIEELYYAQWDEQWGGPVCCCVRAGLDVALLGAGGMGVLGFTAGDIRRMYPEGVPDWIARQWDNGTVIGTAAVVPGVGFVPEAHGRCQRFEDMPDNVALWL